MDNSILAKKVAGKINETALSEELLSVEEIETVEGGSGCTFWACMSSAGDYSCKISACYSSV